jgi:carboxymethylenebutenolidase
MALRDYLAEEIAFDFADAQLSRREALKRLGLLGLSATAAGALLAACSSDGGESAKAPPKATATTAAPASSTTTSTVPAPATAESITFAGPNGQLQGAFAAAARPKGAVLVIHENRGLTDHIRTIPPRFAADGYSALAIDLLSEEGGTAALGGDAQAIGALAAAPTERLVADMRAGIGELQRRVPNRKVGMIGFCFGGGMTWTLLAAGEPRLAAATPFYGPTPVDANFSGSTAAVLAVYGSLDARVNGTRAAAVSALEAAGLTYEIKEYEGANHAFFNDTGPNYNADAATQAYQAVLDWYGRYLA